MRCGGVWGSADWPCQGEVCLELGRKREVEEWKTVPSCKAIGVQSLLLESRARQRRW